MKLGFIASYASTGLGMAGVSVAATGYPETGALCIGAGALGLSGRALLADMTPNRGGPA